MRAVQCPIEADPRDGERSVFLAGGISNCPDWQSQLLELLREMDWLLINPRREDFDSSNPAMSKAQIAWEHRHLRLATAIAFWFPPQTLCPITLYELGAWSMTQKPLFVGVDPQYKRRMDVLEQTRLVRPDVRVVDSLEELTTQLSGGRQ
jgi:Nucleoside 2-deoxyribosyltransferase like